jgi:hypothetical protein
VDSHQQKKVKVEREGKMKQKPKPDVSIHHNVQSINNKLLELNVLLQSELADVDVLCLSEHWLREELIIIDKFKLATIPVEVEVTMVFPVFMLNSMCKLRK